MKKDIDKIINLAKDINMDKPLLSNEEIRNIVNKLHSGNTINNILKTQKRYIIMSITTILIITMYILFTSNNETGIQQNISLKSNSVMQMHKDNKKYFSNSFIANSSKSKEHSALTQESETNIKKSKNEKVNNKSEQDDFKNKSKRSYGFMLVKDTSKNKSTMKNPIFYVDSLKTLKLTIEEFEKLVPNSKINDSTFYFYNERIISNEKEFKRYDLKKAGFTLNDLPLIRRHFNVMTMDKKKGPGYYRFYGSTLANNEYLRLNDYSKTLYVAYSTMSMYSTNNSPILDMSDNRFYREYSKFNGNLSLALGLAYHSKDTAEINRLHKISKENDEKLFSEIIPVEVDIINNYTHIFWFVPTKEFLSTIPEKYSVNLKKELEIKRKIEAGEIDIFDACKGFDKEKSVFRLCDLSQGAIKFENVYPNPSDGNTKLLIHLLESRSIKVSLFDMNGNFVKDLETAENLPSGEHIIKINLTELDNGIYIIAISTNYGEIITKRIFKL